MSMKEYIEKCLAGKDLSADEASNALEIIMTNGATESQIAGLLVALRAKGETVDEVFGFARTMREHSVKIDVEDPDAIDLCGTGGDGLGTVNISTIASFVVAGAGVTVAKHGNRSVSSQTGSADLLSALGVNVQASPEKAGECVNRAGIGFLFAPVFHPAMKHAAKPRAELGVRTIFNMLGPITNPAGVKKQLVGAYETSVASNLAGALARLDTGRACVVHSSDGLDEVSLSASTSVFEVNGDRSVRRYYIHPEDFGFGRSFRGALRGGDTATNKQLALGILNGEHSPLRDVVVANAALGIRISGKAGDLREGRAMAQESIDSRRAMQKLEALIEVSNGN